MLESAGVPISTTTAYQKVTVYYNKINGAIVVKQSVFFKQPDTDM